jgi:hypothetical protein
MLNLDNVYNDDELRSSGRVCRGLELPKKRRSRRVAELNRR